jgi:hypothetical protein
VTEQLCSKTTVTRSRADCGSPSRAGGPCGGSDDEVVRAACAAGALYVGQQRAVMVGHDTVVGVHREHLQDFLEERTARTYGRVALDAIETHAGALQHHWDPPPPTATGLFSSANTAITSRRRRHAQAPARVPLAGILASDATQLDHLAEAWGAGSRSALVEAALRLYLRLV